MYANSLNSLGVLYSKMGEFKKAESYYLNSISIRKEFYGEMHLNYANSLGNMARLYAQSGQHKKSEDLSLMEIAIYRKILGENHPTFANGINGLAVLYKETGQLEKSCLCLFRPTRFMPPLGVLTLYIL